jgi:uncharacterized protein (DUF305 family)
MQTNPRIKLSKNALTAALIAASLLLTGCTAETAVQDHSDHMVSENSEFSAADVMFAQMMIPHHQQAVELGAIALNGEASAEVLALAKKIADDQTHEIEHMEAWLDAAGASDHMDHDMAMDGMLTEEQLDTLKAAKGPEFDRLFLEGMIAHHEGAIAMAKDVENSKNKDVAEMAASIIETQTAEIEYMKELLAK